MIKVFKSYNALGYALYDLKTKKFQYGELCSIDRLVTIINSFPEHEVTIYVSIKDAEELDELFYRIPQLKDLSKVVKQRKVEPAQMLAGSTKMKKKRSFILTKITTGIAVGLLFLIPTSQEYKSSVMVQAEEVAKFTTEFKENQPSWDSVSSLYSSIKNLQKKVKVESIKYSSREYTILFATATEDLDVEDFKAFNGAVIKKMSTLKNTDGVIIYIYEMKGEI